MAQFRATTLLKVHFCDSMILLRAFLCDDGADVISAWYAEYQNLPTVRTRLDTLMMHLRCQRREGWTRPCYDTLRDGVGEVRFRIRTIRYRWLGYFGPARNEFTFLFFSTKTNAYDPPNAIDIAADRRQVVEAVPDRSRIIRGRWHQE
jgi:hypothetical protein